MLVNLNEYMYIKTFLCEFHPLYSLVEHGINYLCTYPKLLVQYQPTRLIDPPRGRLPIYQLSSL